MSRELTRRIVDRGRSPGQRLAPAERRQPGRARLGAVVIRHFRSPPAMSRIDTQSLRADGASDRDFCAVDSDCARVDSGIMMHSIHRQRCPPRSLRRRSLAHTIGHPPPRARVTAHRRSGRPGWHRGPSFAMAASGRGLTSWAGLGRRGSSGSSSCRLLTSDLQDAHGAAERPRRIGQLLGPEQHDQHDRDDQDLPRAVEKVADHGRSLRLVTVCGALADGADRPSLRAQRRPEPVRAVPAEVELAVAARAVHRADGGAAPVARRAGLRRAGLAVWGSSWRAGGGKASHTLHSSHRPGRVGPIYQVCSLARTRISLTATRRSRVTM